MTAPPSPRKVLATVVAVVAGFLVLAIVIGAIGEACALGVDRSPVPTPWPAYRTPPPNWNIAVPTRRPAPTPTQRPQTPTPVPRCQEPAERAYMEQLVLDIAVIVNARAEVGSLFLEAGRDAALITDADWLRDVTFRLGLIEALATDIAGRHPPPSLLAIGTPAGRWAREWTKAVPAFRDGLRQVDPDRLAEGEHHMERAAGYLVDTREASRRLCE